jgi:hypothetical protein
VSTPAARSIPEVESAVLTRSATDWVQCGVWFVHTFHNGQFRGRVHKIGKSERACAGEAHCSGLVDAQCDFNVAVAAYGIILTPIALSPSGPAHSSGSGACSFL